jgi:hypothetical protein
MRTSLLSREETPDDSEPLIENSQPTKLTISGGESNVHFVPEGPEDEDSSHVGEEKSLIHDHDLVEDRPRLPTPPPSLTKVVSFGDVTNTVPPSPYPPLQEETILPPPKQFHPKHRHTSSISIAPQAYPKISYASQQYQPPPSVRRRSSVKSASGGNSSSANLQVLGSRPEQRRRTSVPVMPSSSGHGNLQQIASYPADSTAIRNLNNSFPSERFYTAHSESASSDVGRREKVRLQRHGTGEMSASSDILNAGTKVSTVVGSVSDGGGGKVSAHSYLLNGGGADLLISGSNVSSPNVAAMVKTSLSDQGE